MAKCQIYPEEEAVWAFQPFGPDEDIRWMAMLGSHYRGFPIIKIGELAREQIERGEYVQFRYSEVWYVAIDGKVMTKDEYLSPIIEQHNRMLDQFLGRKKA